MRIIVLFNLNDGVDPAEYEAWARTTDGPIVNGMASVDGFTVHRATGIFGDDSAKPPYDYIEVLDVNDMDGFVGAISTEEFQSKIAAQFGEFADNPTFITTEDV